MRLTADRYRFHLQRDLGPREDGTLSTLCWVMFNPSTADEETDDQTLLKVRQITERAGYRYAHVVNLSAMRATDPKDLTKLVAASNAYHDENCEAVESAMRHARAVVFAWGAIKAPKGLLLAPALWLAAARGLEPLCLGKTAAGHPKHPVRLSPATALVPFNEEETT